MTQEQTNNNNNNIKETPSKDKKKEKNPDEDLSEEDLELLNQLEQLVNILSDSSKISSHEQALDTMSTTIKTATTSMTSVPKPLKFLSRFYDTLVSTYESWMEDKRKLLLSDILSILSMTHGDESNHLCLKYRLSGSQENLESWGHEYIRYLSLEIGKEFNVRQSESNLEVDDLLKLALEIVPFFLKHNAEADAVDLLYELESIEKLPQFVDKNTYERVGLYMVRCVNLLPPPDDVEFLRTAYSIYFAQEQWTHAILLAIRLSDTDLIKETFFACPEGTIRKQLAFLLARQDLSIEVEDQEYIDIFNSTHLSKHFLTLAKELDVLEPKLPNDIYKTHLENNFGSSGVDSASQNLASTFTNAFVNAAFCSDKLITNTEDSNVWVYKHKDHGKVSAVAALGMIYLWDVETGLAQIDRYMYSNDDYTKAGALLGIGILTNRTKSENDPAFALLSEYVYGTNNTTRIGAIAGLGIAHAGSNHADLVEHLLPLVTDTTVSMEISSMAALSIGMICVGSLNGEVTSSILQTFMEREDAQLKDTHARFMGLGLALLCLGRQDASEPILEALKTISHPLSDLVYVMVLASSFAGTGNVLKVQEMLHICNDHLDKEKEDDQYQAFAVLGVALIAMGEEVGSEMAMRTFSHLMHYGEPVIRRAVPLAIALECTSNPTVPVLDTLSKYSHDNDANVAINAIFALGLVGAGTNNARLAQMLRQLASYYHKDPNCLFMVRIAQGLLHMGKGTLSATPSHSDRNLLSPTALSGLLVTLTALTDANNTIFASSHYFLYYLVTAIYPRFLITLDESLEPLPTTVRVGQAVDVVGQAGRPKTITGFQTHSTPVLLAYSERAELATEEYISCSHILESFVILKKNPDYKDEKDD